MRAFLFTLLTAMLQSGAFAQAGQPIPPSDSSQRAFPGPAVDSAAPPQLEKDPVLTTFVKADYPPQLVRQGIAGLVTLDLLVSEKGSVDSVAVVSGVHPLLDSAAAKAARAFVFSPAMADSQPVAVILQYAYRFTIEEVAEKIEQYINLQGRLVERGSRDPIANATVAVIFSDTACDTSLQVPWSAYLKKIGGFGGQYVEGGELITTADSAGYFKFTSLPVCEVGIKVLAPDFQLFYDRVTLRRGEATDVILRLDRGSIGTNEIVVYGKREKKEVAQRTLTLNEVRKIPGLGGDAVKVVQALPGVARAPLGSGAIIIRGSGSGDSHFYLDGVTIPLLFHFGSIKSTYNSDALESVDLYPGGFGTRYGNAVGGVVEIKGRRPKTDRVHGYVDVNLFDAAFMVEGPISDKWSFLLSGRRSYIADVLVFGLELLDLQLPFTVVPYYWDYLARVDYFVSKKQHCYVTLFGARDKFDIIVNEARGLGSSEIGEEKNRASMATEFHLGIAGWDWEIGEKNKNEVRYAACKLSGDDKIFGFLKIKERGLAHYLRDEYTYTASDRLAWHFGADMQFISYDLDMKFPNAKNVFVHDKAHYDLGPYGAYIFADYKPVPKLTLIPGLRYDYYPELIHDGSVAPEFWPYRSFDNRRGTSGEPSLRMTARYETVEGQTLKASAGNYNITPQPMGQSIDKKWGTKTLSAQKASHYVLGYEWKLNDLVSADLQGYYNRQWDIPRTPDSVDLANDPALQSVNFLGNGKARMGGLELLLRHDQGKRFFGWLAYSIGKSERWNYNENRWAIFSEDETHNLQLIGNYRLTPTQEFGARFRYTTGKPTTPILGADYYDATNMTYVPKKGPDLSGRMGPYVALDVRYEKKFTYNLWQWYVYLDVTHVENLFGKGYKSPEYGDYEWNYDYSQKNVLSDITRPALGIKVEF